MKTSDIPDDIWEAAQFVMGWEHRLMPDNARHLTGEVARALLAERLKERERMAKVDEPVWLAELDVLRAALRMAEYILADDHDHTTAEHETALRAVREAVARKPPTSIRSRP
jgi:hypothetical protein